MEKITKKRKGEYLKTALKIILDNGGYLPSKKVVDFVEKKIDFNGYEKEILKSGFVRWQAYLHLFSIDTQRAGWLRKQKGIWYITEEDD